jgi:hypothetical protein
MDTKEVLLLLGLIFEFLKELADWLSLYPSQDTVTTVAALPAVLIPLWGLPW